MALHREGTDGRLAPAGPLMPDGCNVRRYYAYASWLLQWWCACMLPLPSKVDTENRSGDPALPCTFCHFYLTVPFRMMATWARRLAFPIPFAGRNENCSRVTWRWGGNLTTAHGKVGRPACCEEQDYFWRGNRAKVPNWLVANRSLGRIEALFSLFFLDFPIHRFF